MDPGASARLLPLAVALAASAIACAHPTTPAAAPPAAVPQASAAPRAAAPQASAPPAAAPQASAAAAPAPSKPPRAVDPDRCYSRDPASLAKLVPPPGTASAPGSIFMASPPAPESAGPADKPGPGPQVRGSVDKEVIRRVIRRHINEVKACYEPEVAAHPYLAGTIRVLFLISKSGVVSQTHVNQSTMGYPPVEECVARAMCGWEFPPPIGGGSVLVNYPYKLSPAPGSTDP